MLTLIAALAENRVIGNHGQLPWNLPEDLARFKLLTAGHTVIMGRKTYESIGRPLPNRRNIVVSTTLPSVPGIEVYPTLRAAIDAAQHDAFIIGGARIYAEALPFATRMLLSHVHGTYAGDTLFPEFSRSEWDEQERTKSAGHDFAVYVRRTHGAT